MRRPQLRDAVVRPRSRPFEVPEGPGRSPPRWSWRASSPARRRSVPARGAQRASRAPGSSRPTRSTRAPERPRSTSRATAIRAPSPAPPGRPAGATAARCRSTGRAAASTSAASEPSTRAASRSRRGSRRRRTRRRTSPSSGRGPGAGAGPMIWVDHLEGRYRLTTGQGLESYLDSGETPVAGTWQHLAATFDGTVARFYIDGTEVAEPHDLRRARSGEHLARRRLRRHADRVLRRRDRRDPDLLARTERRGDRRGPRRGARRSRHDAAERAGNADRDRRVRPGEPHLGRRDRRGRGGSLQRAPLDDGGLHARCVEPHRAADRHQLPRLAARGRHVLLPGDRPGRCRQRRAAVEPGERDGHGRHDAAAGLDHEPCRRDRQRADLRHGERNATTSRSPGSSSSGTGRTSGPEDTTAPYSVPVGHAQRAQRHPRAHSGRPRHAREHGHVEPCHGHRVEHRRLHGRPARGVRPRRRRGDNGGRLVGQPQDSDARGRRRLVDEPDATAAPSRSTGRRARSTRPRSARSTRQPSRSRPGCSSSRRRSTSAWSALGPRVRTAAR